MKRNRYLGQNFLQNEDVLSKIVDTARLEPADFVVEVGAGKGALTEKLEKEIGSRALREDSDLAKKDARGLVLALELDYRLVSALRQKFKGSKTVKIVHKDALKFDWEGLPEGYKVVANIPYQITSPLLHLWTFALSNRPRSLTLMLQKEVAQRLTSKPGSSKRGLPTVMVELFGEAQYIQTVSRDSFYPPPKVESALVKIDSSAGKNRTRNGDSTSFKVERAVLSVAKAGFANKRRTLENSLAGSWSLAKNDVNVILKRAGIDPRLRAEDLTIKDWRRLTDAYADYQNKTLLGKAR